MDFYGHTLTGGKGIQTREATFQRMDALTDGHPAPAQFPRHTPLSACPRALTVRAIKSRRVLPVRDRAVSMQSALREAVCSIGILPAKGYLEQTR
jgi:hypothetical protein